MKVEFGIIAVSVLAAALASPAYGEARGVQGAPGYPSKPVRLVAPFPPGGSSDLLARILAQRLAETWGQPVVTDNRPGAAGSLGAALVAKSPADGYTLLLGGISPVAINVHLYRHIGYDPLRDFTTGVHRVGARRYRQVRQARAGGGYSRRVMIENS